MSDLTELCEKLNNKIRKLFDTGKLGVSTAMKCKKCGSFAINHHMHDRDGTEPELCDVCFWRKREELSHCFALAAKNYIDGKHRQADTTDELWAIANWRGE